MMTSPHTNDERARRLRSRNRALLAVLLALVVLFYAITVIRMSEVDDRRHEQSPGPHGMGSTPVPAERTP